MSTTTTVTYNADEPAHPQNQSYDCSQESAEWALYSVGRSPSDEWMTSSMVSEGVMSPELGLLDASGAGLAGWLTRQYGEYGFSASNDGDVSFDDVAAEIGPYPLMIGGRSWGAGGHWSGVRGFDPVRGVLLLANPADGYGQIYQTMSRDQWAGAGPWSMVRLIHPDLLGAVTEPPPSEIASPYPEGIDVSNNNGHVEWDAVGASGQVFAIVKISEGTWFRDSYARRNWSEAKRVGLYRGGYHFGRPSECSGGDEARYFVEALGALGCELEPGDLVALDLEDPDVAGSANLAAYTLDWLATAHGLLGFAPLVYTTPSYAHEHRLAQRPEIGAYPLWLASWGVPTPPPPPLPWRSVAFHQYGVSAVGSVPGVAGECDRNRFNGPEDSIPLYGMSGAVAPPEPPETDDDFVVGTGLLDAMLGYDDTPASDEIFVKSASGRDAWSEAIGMSGARYVWTPKLGRVSRFEPT